MRVMGYRGAPGVEHRGEADLDAQTLGIGCDCQHRLRGSFEQEIVDDATCTIAHMREREKLVRH